MLTAKCKKCGDAIQVEEDTGEYVTCKCGAIGLDGGHCGMYRVTGNPEDFDGKVKKKGKKMARETDEVTFTDEELMTLVKDSELVPLYMLGIWAMKKLEKLYIVSSAISIVAICFACAAILGWHPGAVVSITLAAINCVVVAYASGVNSTSEKVKSMIFGIINTEDGGETESE